MTLTVAPGLAARLERLAATRMAVLRSATASDCGLVALAAGIAPLAVAFLVRHGTGYLRVPILNSDADRLNLPLMRGVDGAAHTQRYTVSVDAAAGITTGISAADRARTIGLLAAPTTVERDLCRPGHVVPVRVNAAATRVYEYPEAAVDAARLIGEHAAAVFTEVVRPDRPTELLGADGLADFAQSHALPVLEVDELAAAAGAAGLRPTGQR